MLDLNWREAGRRPVAGHITTASGLPRADMFLTGGEVVVLYG
jgi:hypothetical protein